MGLLFVPLTSLSPWEYPCSHQRLNTTSNIVKVDVVKIGNFQGIRIPKLVLEQVGLSGKVEMEVAADHLVLRRVRRPARGGKNTSSKSPRKERIDS